MTITMTAELLGHVGYVVTCCDGAARHAPRFGSPGDAAEALSRIPGGSDYGCEDIRPVLPGCELPETCPDYPLDVQGIPSEDAPLVDMHNRNAALVFDALGLPDAVDAVHGGDSGCLTGHDFLGRVLTASALAPHDEGIPAHHTTPGRGVEGARRAGYLHEQLHALEHLARWCAARDLDVVWA